MIKKEFQAVFQINKMITFEVDYYTLSNNKSAHFSTSANEFIRSKRDYLRGGQAQADLLPKGSKARAFWEKWDSLHLCDLTDEQYTELLKDIEELKANYNYIFDDLSDRIKPYNPNISFWRVVELSKQEPKKIRLKA